MLLIDGKSVAREVRESLAEEIARARGGRPPGLAVFLVGDDPASAVYVAGKERACRETGIRSTAFRLPRETPQRELLERIAACNRDDAVDGILVQLPLPAHLDTLACILAIDPAKDVDGFHPENVGRLSLGLPCLPPCTPAGVVELMRRYDLPPAGKLAVVAGRSNIVGKPLATMLAANGPYGNATVTVCHSRTPNLAEECRRADFLFLAMGRPGSVTADMVKPGAVVFDVGITRTPEGLKGDADFESLRDKVRALTPVPGGVGPMTIAMLLRNTVRSWSMRCGKG
ncbi:MAG: bifunctional methylenetetrahydrofolate dehydrogenase/methenyltetrahydrofolate cyclohydrolase FolD [Desulfovibrio sp.]|jgi:methylenetetrahydrofolate dehydrogenase (NADP+)/methenyltetrahydrofolate cyclohydrolase|nr:bifunctional methylenetetrahydrofolate dehydrogenase/methenyltetrahydrofolate cyclohydrolase FolD [Desulfovibrio sp.]